MKLTHQQTDETLDFEPADKDDQSRLDQKTNSKPTQSQKTNSLSSLWPKACHAMNSANLRLDWCSIQAARFACLRWHYSRSLPTSKLVKIGVWENNRFIGCVVFGSGASNNIGSPFSLKQTEICELVRVALDHHQTPVSRIIKIAIKMLRQQSPGLRLIVSYADSAQGHHGGIYAAGGWLYLGAAEHYCYILHGKQVHPRTVRNRYGRGDLAWLQAKVDPKAQRITTPAKHKYAFPLDESLRAKLLPLAKPYPKRAGSADGGTPDYQSGGGGSIPTPALSTSLVKEEGGPK